MSGGGDFEMTSTNDHMKLKRSGSNASLHSEIDSDFDFDEFHDTKTLWSWKYDAWNESGTFWRYYQCTNIIIQPKSSSSGVHPRHRR